MKAQQLGEGGILERLLLQASQLTRGIPLPIHGGEKTLLYILSQIGHFVFLISLSSLILNKIEHSSEQVFILYLFGKYSLPHTLHNLFSFIMCLILFRYCLFLHWSEQYFWYLTSLTKLFLQKSHTLFIGVLTCPPICSANPDSYRISVLWDTGGNHVCRHDSAHPNYNNYSSCNPWYPGLRFQVAGTGYDNRTRRIKAILIC